VVEGHSSDLDHANRGGKFAKGQFGEEKSEFAVMVMVAIRENRKFNLRVSPLDKNSLAPLNTLPFSSIGLKSECRRLVEVHS